MIYVIAIAPAANLFFIGFFRCSYYYSYFGTFIVVVVVDVAAAAAAVVVQSPQSKTQKNRITSYFLLCLIGEFSKRSVLHVHVLLRDAFII